MNTAEHVMGESLTSEGYTTDSYGLPIDPGAMYCVECVRWTEVTGIWRMGLSKPKEPKPITKQ